MPTKYLDLTNGSDANNGSSWALAKKTRQGFTAGTLSAGDTVLVAKSSDPTSIGTATWTQYPLGGSRTFTATTATPIVVTVTSHGYSTGDIVAIYQHTQYQANGYWIITKLTDNTFSLDGSIGSGAAAGSGGTLYKASAMCIKLDSAVTTTIDVCNVKWTAGTNCTTTQHTLGKQNGFYISTNASVTGAQKLAYKQLPSTLDLSGKQQITFWCYTETAPTAGLLQIKLCTDAAGDTPADTLNIPAKSASTYCPITIDKGSALSSGINSIAVYCTGSYASKTYGLIFASPVVASTAPSSADSITCQSLIGKSNTVGGKWYPIGVINNKIISLTAQNTHNITEPISYNGNSAASITTYKRESIKSNYADTYPAPGYDSNAGTAANYITWKGGVNTATDLQDGETFVDVICTVGLGLYMTYSYNKVERICLVRYSWGVYVYNRPTTGVQLYDLCAVGCNGGVYFDTATDLTISGCNFNNNYYGIQAANTNYNVQILTDIDVGTSTYAPFYVYGAPIFGLKTKSIDVSGSLTSSNYAFTTQTAGGDWLIEGNLMAKYCWGTYGAVSFNTMRGVKITGTVDVTGSCWNQIYSGNLINIQYCSNIIINTLTAVGIKEAWQTWNYGAYSLFAWYSDNIYILSGELSGCWYGSAQVNNSVLHFRNTIFGKSTEVAHYLTAIQDTQIYSMDHDGTWGTHRVFYNGGQADSETTVRHTASGISWKISPTSATIINSTFPIVFHLGEVICGSAVPVTVNVWLRRSNTGLTMTLAALGGYLKDVDSDVTSSITEIADQWQQVSISFTPGEDGAIPIDVRVYGGTSYSGYVDDLSIT